MPEIVNDVIVFNSDDLKWFAEYFGDTEWAVYVYGMDEVRARQDPDLSDDDPENPAHTEASAREYAAWVNTEMPSVRRESVRSFAAVLHYGAPETAVA